MSNTIKDLEAAATGVVTEVKDDVAKIEADVKPDTRAAYIVAGIILAIGVVIGQAVAGIFGI